MFDLSLFDKMIWIDYAVSVLVVVSSFFGLLRGFIKEAFALVTWVIAIWVSLQYSRDIAELLQDTISEVSVRNAASFGLLFVMTLALGALIRFILNQLIEKAGLTGSDRLLGMLFGTARGIFLVLLMVMFAVNSPLPKEPWWRQSLLIPPLQSLAIWLKDHIPSGLMGYIHYR